MKLNFSLHKIYLTVIAFLFLVACFACFASFYLYEKNTAARSKIAELNKVFENDRRLYKEYEQIQNKNNSLLLDIASGNKRMYYLQQKNSGLDSGERVQAESDGEAVKVAPCFFDRKTAEELIKIAADGDEAIVKLEALKKLYGE